MRKSFVWFGAIILLLLLTMPVIAVSYTDVIGFQWNISIPSPTVTRVWANGTTASVDGAYFNNHIIWGNIKKVLVNRSSQQVYYGTNNRGDGLTFTGAGSNSGNQTMIEIPQFWEFNSYSGTTFTYLVSPTQYNESFTVAPMFNQRGGYPALHYYIGAYDMAAETYNGVTTGTSYTNQAPVVSQTIGTMRTYAERNGAGWGLYNIWSWSGIRELLYIETGTLNSQVAWANSRGIVDAAAAKNSGADSADSNINAENATGGGTGTNGLTPAVYHGIENGWGNIWQFIDGQNSYTSGANSVWNNINPNGLNSTGGVTIFKNLLPSSDYQQTTTTTIGDGYQTAVSSVAGNRNLFIPTSTTGGSDTTYLSDYFYYPRSTFSSTPNILIAGGAWFHAGSAGVGFWGSHNAASAASGAIGARLEFRANAPVTNFSYTVTNPATVAVTFTDTTTQNPTSWAWYYTNATGSKVLFSNSQNPSYTFGSNTWQIELDATNVDSTSIKTATLPMSASFTQNAITGYMGDIFQFTDTSVGGVSGWNWSFGDGTFATTQNPTHSYSTMGDYSVTLNTSRIIY